MLCSAAKPLLSRSVFDSAGRDRAVAVTVFLEVTARSEISGSRDATRLLGVSVRFADTV